jgi:hypothetical protein
MREHTTGPLFLGDSPALVGVLLLHLQSSLVLPNSQLNTKVGSLVYSTALPGFPSPAATKSSSSSNPSKFLSKSNPLVPVVFESLTTTHQVIPVSPTPTIAITWKICSSYFDCFITTHQNVCSSLIRWATHQTIQACCNCCTPQDRCPSPTTSFPLPCWHGMLTRTPSPYLKSFPWFGFRLCLQFLFTIFPLFFFDYKHQYQSWLSGTWTGLRACVYQQLKSLDGHCFTY